MASFKIKYLFLFLIILLAFLLRFFRIDEIPNSLYTDEIDQGYNAYSILKTGSDEHGTFLPVSLRSFGDWKPPLPTYLIVPFIKVFGLNEFSVRIPSVILGVMTIWLSYLLTGKLLEDYQHKNRLSLFIAYFLTISAWHILQSRSAMLVMVSFFFLLWGIYLLLSARNRISWLYLSIFSFVLTIYSYYGMRLVTPIIFIYLIVHFRQYFRKFRHLAGCTIFGLLLLLPLFIGYSDNNEVIFGRARTVSIFYDQGIKLRQWELITQDGRNYPTLLSRYFHNSYYLYSRNIFQRFLSHFDIRYLIFTGDQSQPFQIPNMGIIYFIDPLMIITGLYILYRYKFKSRNIIFSLLLVSFIPASLTFMTPSSNRTFNAIFPFTLLSSLGLIEAIRLVKNKYLAAMVMVLIYFFNFNFFMKQYFLTMPLNYSDWWNYGYKNVADYIKTVGDRYQNIFIFDDGGMPYIYLLFYGQIDPASYQKYAVRSYIPDQFGFEHVDSYLKYYFPYDRKWKDYKDNLLPKSLYVVPIRQEADDRNYLNTISSPTGKVLFKLFSHD